MTDKDKRFAEWARYLNQKLKRNPQISCVNVLVDGRYVRINSIYYAGPK